MRQDHQRHGQNRGQQRPRNKNRNQNLAQRSMDSNGPDMKIKGTAAHICKKYQALARDAQSVGDRIRAENYLQHADHYYRLVMAAQSQQQQQQQSQQSQRSQQSKELQELQEPPPHESFQEGQEVYKNGAADPEFSKAERADQVEEESS